MFSVSNVLLPDFRASCLNGIVLRFSDAGTNATHNDYAIIAYSVKLNSLDLQCFHLAIQYNEV